MTGFWRAETGALLVRVKVQPKARRPGLEGLRPGLNRHLEVLDLTQLLCHSWRLQPLIV